MRSATSTGKESNRIHVASVTSSGISDSADATRMTLSVPSKSAPLAIMPFSATRAPTNAPWFP